MNENRLGIASVAQEPDDALRLAERIGPDEVRALRKLRHRFQERRDLLAIIRMAEDRKAERGLGDEDIAGRDLVA